jgi:phage terminase large subunit-like protein
MMAVDVGYKKDSAALVWAQWHDHPTRRDKDGNPVRMLHIGQRILLPEEIEGLGIADTRELVGKYNGQWALREVPYDPFAFRESAEELEERGVPMVQFDQTNARMVPASEETYELIADERLVHDGDPEARRQVLQAVVQETERGVRISKRRSKARIDFTVGLAMVVRRMLENERVDRSAVFI